MASEVEQFFVGILKVKGVIGKIVCRDRILYKVVYFDSSELSRAVVDTYCSR